MTAAENAGKTMSLKRKGRLPRFLSACTGKRAKGMARDRPKRVKQHQGCSRRGGEEMMRLEMESSGMLDRQERFQQGLGDDFEICRRNHKALVSK